MLRVMDLLAPVGFGQRLLIRALPGADYSALLRKMCAAIGKHHLKAHLMMLLVGERPEEVTEIKESFKGEVVYSTFDDTPDVQTKTVDLALERAMRLVEQQKDVVLLVDSLTRLAKIYTTAAAQQGRSLPGMVNPSSLFRAKRLFGSARACKEGGSLTVLAAMDIATGSKVDDSVVEEFKGTANMELMLDQNVARAGVTPSLNLQQSYTKNADILLDDRQKEGLTLIRTMLGNTSSSVAIPQLESMMDKTDTNAALLLKMKDWVALMNR
jgi:transcription termination factor Rho